MFPKKRKPYRDLKTVESLRNELVPEEFPEGPYGASTHEDELGKDSPWRPTQHASPRFTYEMRDFHEGIPRQIPGSHPTHDESNEQMD